MFLHYFIPGFSSSPFYASIKKIYFIKIVLSILYTFLFLAGGCLELPELNNPNDPSNQNPNIYGSISGIVSDINTSQGISGVSVNTYPGTITAITEANGYYRIEKVLPGTYRVEATMLGYTLNSTSVGISSGKNTIANISLTYATGAISGKITDSNTSQGIQGATITTVPATSNMITDTSGNFTIPNVPDGNYTVNASITGYASNSTPVNVIDGNTSTAYISLSPITGTIIGKISDNTTSQGIQGATVTTNPITGTTTTDTNGNYTISNVTTGSYVVNASKIGYVSNTTPVDVIIGNTCTANISLTLIFVCGSTITDSRDGKVYNSVLLDNQCWLRENLDVGTRINGNQTASNNAVIEKYCSNDDSANCTAYGGLYQWDEAMQYVTNEGVQGICPNGWHLPTIAEFITLRTTVNNDGNSLKEIGQGTGTNTTGFSALLAGNRNGSGVFFNLGDVAYFWSSTEYSANYASYMILYGSGSSVFLYDDGKEGGFSVRCLKD